MHRAIGRCETFDRHHGRSLCLCGQDRAGLDRAAIDVDRASPALAGVTTDVRAGRPSSLRNRSTSSVRGSISAVTGFPLTVRESETGIVPPELGRREVKEIV
jgi:hypothetical protein